MAVPRPVAIWVKDNGMRPIPTEYEKTASKPMKQIEPLQKLRDFFVSSCFERVVFSSHASPRCGIPALNCISPKIIPIPASAKPKCQL